MHKSVVLMSSVVVASQSLLSFRSRYRTCILRFSVLAPEARTSRTRGRFGCLLKHLSLHVLLLLLFFLFHPSRSAPSSRCRSRCVSGTLALTPRDVVLRVPVTIFDFSHHVPGIALPPGDVSLNLFFIVFTSLLVA